MLRPGTGIVRKHGGLHEFMHWDGPILTDSGGFQVFSLAAMRKLSEEGVKFRSPVNGDEVFLTPEKSMEVQHDLNADVTMIFDECTPYPASEIQARESMQLSLRWAARSRAHFDLLKAREPELDYTKCELQPGDPEPTFFSELTRETKLTQVDCHIAYTNPKVHALIEENRLRSPIFNGAISVRGADRDVCCAGGGRGRCAGDDAGAGVQGVLA